MKRTVLLLVGALAFASAAQAQSGRSLDSKLTRDWNGSSPATVFRTLESTSGHAMWPLSAGLPKRIDLAAKGKTVREVLDLLGKQLGLTWKQEGKLVLLTARPGDDPLAGDAGAKQVQGKTLRAWRVALCTARRGGREAAGALRTSGAVGVRVLIQAALGGPTRSRYTALDELRRVDAAGAKLVLEAMEAAPRSSRTMLATVVRGLPGVGAVLCKRLEKGTLAQRLAALELLSSLRRMPPGFAKPALALLDDPQLSPASRRTAGRQIARILYRVDDAQMGEAVTIWKRLLASERTLRYEAMNGLRSLLSRLTGRRSRVAPERRRALFKTLQPLLLDLLNDRSLRLDAASGLGMIARTDAKLAAELVTRLERETDTSMQRALARAVGSSQRAEAIPALLKVLESSPRLESTVSSALSLMGAKAEPALRKALQHTSPRVRRVACRSLVSAVGRRYGKARTAEQQRCVTLLRPLIKDADPGVQEAALEGIARCGAAGEQVILQTLQTAEEASRAATIKALRYTSRELQVKAVPALIRSCEGATGELRIAAAGALRALGERAKGAGPALIKLLSDAEPRVQAAAASALSRVPCDGAKAAPALVPLLASREYRARNDALQALRSFGPETAAAGIDAMVQLVASADPNTQRAGLDALTLVGARKHAAALKAVTQAAQNPEPAVRAAAAGALSSLAPSAQETQDLLFVLVEDERASVRVAACRAYLKLEVLPKAHREALAAAAEELLAERSYQLQTGGVYLLGRLARDSKQAQQRLMALLDDPANRSASYRVQGVLAQLGTEALPLLAKAIQANPRSKAVDALYRISKVDKTAVPALKGLLGSKARRARQAAARLLASLKADAAPARDELVKALADSDYSVRSEAMRALESLGAAAVVPLAKRLTDPGARSDHYRIARALQRLGPKAKAAVPHLIKGLAAKSRSTSDACGRALAAIGAPAEKALLVALADPNPTVQANAARALTQIKPPRAETFAKLLGMTSRRGLSRYTLVGMAKALGPKALPGLRAALGGEDREAVSAALECVRALGAKARPLLDALLPLAGDRRLGYSVRRVLRSVGAGEAELKLVRAALESKDRAQREAAVVLLGGAGKLAVPMLKELLNGGPPELRSAAVSAAAALGADAAPLVTELVEVLSQRGMRWTAERALAAIKGPAVAPLVSALSSEEPTVRESAARTLGKIGPKLTAVAKGPLLSLLEKEPEPSVRLQAALALGPLGADPKRCLPILFRDWEAVDPGRSVDYHVKAILSFGEPGVAALSERLQKDLAYSGLAVRKRAIDAVRTAGRKLDDATVAKITPQLIKVAGEDPSPTLQLAAIQALGSLGARAKAALEVLKELERTGGRRLSRQARYARMRIEQDLRYRSRRR